MWVWLIAPSLFENPGSCPIYRARVLLLILPTQYIYKIVFPAQHIVGNFSPYNTILSFPLSLFHFLSSILSQVSCLQIKCPILSYQGTSESSVVPPELPVLPTSFSGKPVFQGLGNMGELYDTQPFELPLHPSSHACMCVQYCLIHQYLIPCCAAILVMQFLLSWLLPCSATHAK